MRIEDCGAKLGLNGVDNGRIWFDHVRVPRESLLDRYAQLDADGTYFSPIENPTKRFFTMLGTLIQGRISVSGASISASKVALTIAVRRALERRQFGPPGGAEALLLDYRTHQRRLLPALAGRTRSRSRSSGWWTSSTPRSRATTSAPGASSRRWPRA